MKRSQKDAIFNEHHGILLLKDIHPPTKFESSKNNSEIYLSSSFLKLKEIYLFEESSYVSSVSFH